MKRFSTKGVSTKLLATATKVTRVTIIGGAHQGLGLSPRNFQVLQSEVVNFC